MRKNIVLIGMSAAGKSTIGVVVAKRLGYDFLDTDILIQKKENALLKDIINKKGIEGFLEIENRVNKDVNVENTVIAPGGSVVYCQEAMEHLKKNSVVVYLEVPFKVLANRIKNTASRGIVMKENQTLEDVFNERKSLFEKYADITINEKTHSLEEITRMVLASLEGRI